MQQTLGLIVVWFSMLLDSGTICCCSIKERGHCVLRPCGLILTLNLLQFPFIVDCGKSYVRTTYPETNW